MAISTVKFKLNGQTYDLTYDSVSKSYKATISAPSVTSYNANADHKYHGEVLATDNAGNTATASITDFSALGLRVLEKVKSLISVSYPASAALIANNKPVIKWTVKDTDSGINPSTVSIKIDGAAAITSGIIQTPTTDGYSCEYTPTVVLTDGSHTITFNVSDNDGNAASTVSVTFKVDTVPPTLNLTSPEDGFVTNNESLVVAGTTNDLTSSPVTVTITLNAGSEQSVVVGSDGAFSHTLTLVEGKNTIVVKATDSAGKSTSITRTVSLDTTAPTISAVTITPNPVDAGATYIVTVSVTD